MKKWMESINEIRKNIYRNKNVAVDGKETWEPSLVLVVSFFLNWSMGGVSRCVILLLFYFHVLNS